MAVDVQLAHDTQIMYCSLVDAMEEEKFDVVIVGAGEKDHFVIQIFTGC